MDYSEGKLISVGMDAVKECPPCGIYLLASVLKEEGHDVLIADMIADGSIEITKYLDGILKSGLIGISATSMSWPTAVEVIQQIRTIRPEVSIVLGGIHPTMFDEYILTKFDANYVVRGEGEIAIVKLCEAIEDSANLSSVPNLTWRDASGSIRRNSTAPKITKDQLGLFPAPDFSILAKNVYKGLSIESSRGCAFNCSFCSTSYRRTWRGIPATIFVDRLEQLLHFTDRTRHEFIHIIDDEFTMNPRRAMAIADLLQERQISCDLVYDARANDLLFDGLIEKLKPFTHAFLIGAECGYDEGLKLIGKGTTTEKLEKAAYRLAHYGLADQVEFSFILGLPWETKVEVEKTINFAGHLHSNYGVTILLQWYCQIPGSRLWQEAREKQLVNETMYDDFGFFRDLYLFRTGVKLKPEEIWEVSERIQEMIQISKLRCLEGSRIKYLDEKQIEYRVPEPIRRYYPKAILGQIGTGLDNLKDVAYPKPGIELPRRKISRFPSSDYGIQ